LRAREGWGALGVPAFLSFVAVSHFKALKENMEGRGGRDPRGRQVERQGAWPFESLEGTRGRQGGGKEPRASFLPSRPGH